MPRQLIDHKGAKSRYMTDEEDEGDSALALFGERFEVRETAKKNLYTGKTYNSVENVRGFFEQRGINVPVPPKAAEPKPSAVPPPAAAASAGEAPPWSTTPSAPRPPAAPPAARPQQQQQLFGAPQTQPARPPGSLAYGGPPKQQPVKRPGSQHVGSLVQHPKYGRGTVLRQEGDGEDAKLTISFPGYGLKKLIAKLAGLKP